MIKEGQIYQTTGDSVFKIKILSRHGDRLYIRAMRKDKGESYIADEKFQEYIDTGSVVMIRDAKENMTTSLPGNRLEGVE